MTAAGWRGPARGLNGGRDGGGERLGDAWQLLSDNSIPRGSHATEVSRKGCARRTSKGYAEASDDASLSHNRGFSGLSCVSATHALCTSEILICEMDL
jgi:hypothetical protein